MQCLQVSAGLRLGQGCFLSVRLRFRVLVISQGSWRLSLGWVGGHGLGDSVNEK